MPAVSAEAQSRRQKRAARKSMKAGLKHYERKQYDAAIEKLKIALALANEPIVLYHIGRAYQAKKDFAQATYYLKSFIDRAPKSSRRRDAEKRIAAMEAAAKPDPPPETKPDPPPETKPDPPPETKPDPPPETKPDPPFGKKPQHSRAEGKRGMSGLRITGVIGLVAGVGLAATGGYFAKVARDRSNQISDLFASGATWESRYDDLYDEGEVAQRNARILLIAGGGALVTGAVLYLLGGRKSSRPELSVTPSSRGAAVSFSCDW